MKRIFLLGIFLFAITNSYAQYDKEKLSKILTANPWSVTSVHVARPEKKFTFANDQSVQIDKANDKGAIATQKEKWSITTADNLRWFISIGAEKYEMIVSYTKNGSQFIKLTHGAGADKITGYYEMNLNATK